MVVFREVGFARKKKEVVIAGLDPAIHQPFARIFRRGWMRGSKPAHDEQ
jgi:hypothetical protein